MALQYSLTHRTNEMNQLNTDIANSAILKTYTGTIPANVAAAITGNTVTTHNCNTLAFGDTLNGVLTARQIANAVAANSGVITHFRIIRFDGTAVVQGNVATINADLNLDNNNVNSGQTVSLPSVTFTAFGF